MTRIDCSTVIGFVHEASRVCEMHEECAKCPMSERKKCPRKVLEYDKSDVQGIVDELQKWSDEHQVKTRLDDLLEKYPKLPLRDDGLLDFLPSRLGYCEDCRNCRCFENISSGVCWNEPLEGGATGKAVE